jgi:polyphenol oxidase
VSIGRAIDVELPGGRVAFSTRRGGVSRGPYESLNLGFLTEDDETATMANRQALARELELRPERIAMGRQVHGSDIREWGEWPDPSAYAEPRRAELIEVDGHATALRGLAPIVLVADCLPVALIGAGRVAMLHCGWRPLAGGIVEKALAGFDEPPAAAIGPGIGRCCYEVGEEVLAEFADLEGVADGRMLDLRAVVRRKLEAAGVTHIEEVDLCTSCHPELFFSHRRDGGVTGRQGGVAWLT